MKIISLNKNPERYGFLTEMEYKNEDFHGHQLALGIGIKNPDGSWDRVYTSGNTEEERIELADIILNDNSLIILEDKCTQLENNNLITKTVYYFPYYVADHSAYQPTINFNQISDACNVINNVKIEVLFVKDSWYNRYVTFDIKANNFSLMDFIENLGIYIEESAINKKDFFIATEDSNEYDEGNIVLDFYDKSGRKYLYGGDVSSLLKLISSIRIIDIDTHAIVNK